jgi:hypothetical protein
VNEKFVYYNGGDWKKGVYHRDSSYNSYSDEGYKFVGAGKGDYVILSEHFYNCLGGDYSMLTTNIVSNSISLGSIKTGGFGVYSNKDYKYYHSSIPLEYGLGYYYESGVSYSLPKLSELKLDAATGFRIGCDAE